MSAHPMLVVIVATYNSADHITDCLDSLRRETRGMRCRILVIDNHSQDGTRRRVSEFSGCTKGGPELTLIENHANRGFGSAVNQAAEIAPDCDFYLVVNPDVCLRPGAVSEMLTYMKDRPDCGILGPAIQGPSGALTPSAFAFPTVGTEILKLSGIAKYVPNSLRRLIRRIAGRRVGKSISAYLSGYGEMNGAKDLDWISGACLLIRRTALGAQPLFDERFFLYYEDTDLCRRAKDAGYAVRLLPCARAVHSCHGSTGGRRTGSSLKHDYTSMFLYHSLHGTRRDVRRIRFAGIVAAIAQAIATPISALVGKRRLPTRERLSACRHLLRTSLKGPSEFTRERAEHFSYKDALPGVSVVIPVLNEAAHIRSCLEHICSQDYANIAEILLIDGMSADGTRGIIEEFCRRDARFRLMDNPSRGVAAALNVGFSAARGDVIVRADAHALYASDYVSQCVAQLKATGAGNVGGTAVPVEGAHYWERAIVLAHISRFGIGVASFRRQGRRGPVDTVWPGAFPRDVLRQAGKLNETLNRGEDIDLNARIRKLGYSVYQSPAIHVRYVPRRSLKELAVQSFSNGQAVVEALAINPDAVRPRHLIPGVFVSAVALCAIAACATPHAGLLLSLILAAYLAASLCFSCFAGLERGAVYAPAMPVVFGAIHFSYGLGSLAGLCSLIRWQVKGGVPK